MIKDIKIEKAVNGFILHATELNFESSSTGLSSIFNSTVIPKMWVCNNLIELNELLSDLLTEQK